MSFFFTYIRFISSGYQKYLESPMPNKRHCLEGFFLRVTFWSLNSKREGSQGPKQRRQPKNLHISSFPILPSFTHFTLLFSSFPHASCEKCLHVCECLQSKTHLSLEKTSHPFFIHSFCYILYFIPPPFLPFFLRPLTHSLLFHV